MTIPDRIALLRRELSRRGLDGCLVVTDDFHGSEYVGDHFKTREYLSGFTGSAGTLVVLPDQAALWTDGRYFLQAERQLAGSGIDLMRAGQPGVPKLSDFLAERLPEDGVLAFDGRTVSTRLYRTLTDALAPKHIRLDGSRDLADEVWPDRPPLSSQPLWPLESDVSRREKLALLRARMVEKDAAHLLLTDLTALDYDALGRTLEFLANNGAAVEAQALPGRWNAASGTYTVTDASRAAVQTFFNVSPTEAQASSFKEP